MVDRNAEALAQQLLAWPTADRALLAELLLASLEGSESGTSDARSAEIERRTSALDLGAVSTIPASVVLAEIDRRHVRDY